jgi:hypothetical protein
MTWTAVFTILLLVTLGVLGHGIWHSWMLDVMNLITNAFTGGHACDAHGCR